MLLKNIDALITGNEAEPLLRNVDMHISHGVIRAIGTNLHATLSADEAGEVKDMRGQFVYPGLVNTHHHFFQSFVRNRVDISWPELDVLEWLRKIYPIFSRLNEEAIFYASLVSMADLIKHGCTTAFDHHYLFPRHAGKHLIDRQFEAARLIGMRFHAGRGCNTLPMAEGSTIPDELLETTDEFLADCERLHALYHDDSPYSMQRLVIAPCQPVNSYVETFSESIALARDKGLLLHTHLGEGETPLMLARHGQTSMQWCEHIGFVGRDVWFAHGWEFGSAEIASLVHHGSGLSHCPAPMLLVGDGITAISEMHHKGVRLSLGVDGSASNDNSNLLESLRLAYLSQCLSAHDIDFAVPQPQAFFNMASRGGADVLGRQDIGQLKAGMAADLFAIRAQRLEYLGAHHDPLALPVKVGINQTVDMTMINGNIVWQQGEFLHFDEARWYRQGREEFERQAAKG